VPDWVPVQGIPPLSLWYICPLESQWAGPESCTPWKSLPDFPSESQSLGWRAPLTSHSHIVLEAWAPLVVAIEKQHSNFLTGYTDNLLRLLQQWIMYTALTAHKYCRVVTISINPIQGSENYNNPVKLIYEKCLYCTEVTSYFEYARLNDDKKKLASINNCLAQGCHIFLDLQSNPLITKQEFHVL